VADAASPATTSASRWDERRGGRRSPASHALAALPEYERRTLELAWFGGLTVDQIADALDQSKESVLRRLRAAMQHVGCTVPRDDHAPGHYPLSRA
jgi:DNA-directed RNA polymerase specialized sigma24 family protein